MLSPPLAKAALRAHRPQQPPHSPRASAVANRSQRDAPAESEFDADAGPESAAAALPPAHVTHLQSTANAYVKHATRLRTSRAYRDVVGTLLLPGSTLLAEAAEAAPDGLHVAVLLLAEGAAVPSGVTAERTLTASPAVLRRVAGVESGDSLDAVAELRAPPAVPPSAAHRRVLLLDGVQDPGNLGTLLRSAAALRFSAAALLPGCADPFSAKAVRASRGAALRLPLWRATWPQLAALQSSWQATCLGADARGSSQAAATASAAASAAQVPLWLVLGSEGQGLGAEARALSTLVAVPGAGGFESLNVGAAGAILMYLLRE